MRRSASPSKVARGATSARLARSDSDSSAVLKTPFKPLSGLESRRKTAAQQSSSTAATSSTTAAARELRSRTIAELQEEVADMEMILKDKLKTHNDTRTKANLTEQQPEHIVAEYIALLTEYNRVKDSAQLIFDKIADIQQLPAKDIHARYGVGESSSQS